MNKCVNKTRPLIMHQFRCLNGYDIEVKIGIVQKDDGGDMKKTEL